ncbi:LysR family transcriptional regulator [Desulfosporosinus sp. BG]|uniref:LysR family transcriptional regulator n=1 Tax=Desulfosporosinus sp. BG TaxID=1633135 RepID=UPI00085910D3|nr:LysR family transcriptional regulator [Desulfosporosinus sp. BG]ODA40598.1 Transcriptional regulator [Desulfosporosinus sp. BG]
MLHTELYKVFYFTAMYRSLSEAAQMLYISQPAISKSIKKLEALTGCTLFIRNSKGVTLTTEGQILYDYVKSAFETLHNGEMMLEKLKKRTEGIVKVGMSNTLCRYFFLPHLEAFHYQYPGIHIQIINRPSPDTLKLLEQGQLDFGIISIPMDKGDLEYIELMTIQDIFVAGRKYDIPDCALPLKKLVSYPLLMMEAENLSRIHIDDYFRANQLSFTPEIEISSMDILIEFAKIGLGIASVIKSFVTEELALGILKEIPISPAIPERTIGIALKKNIPVSLASQSFIAFLKGTRGTSQ